MNLMSIDKKAVLHVVDIETNLSSATFLLKQTVQGVWTLSFCAGHRSTLDLP